MRAPRVYLAGKIAKNDWRHILVPNLRAHIWADGPIHTKAFSYVGPFFVSCDHGCNHSPGSHGASAPVECGQRQFTREEIIANNNAAIESADLVFGYITDTDCYGTLIEIGCALSRGIRVVLAFAPNIPQDDFWYASMQTAAVHTEVRLCCLPSLLADELAAWALSVTPIRKDQR
jgi:hypothetical protein